MKRATRRSGVKVGSKKAVQLGRSRIGAPFERLESRLFLSGSVLASVKGGNLSIKGDDGANNIVLDQVGLAADQVRITATGATTINHQTDPVIVSGITRAIQIRMGSAVDSVTLNDLSVQRNVVINGGAGANTVTVNDVQSAGLQVQNGSGASTVNVADSTVRQSLSVVAGAGGQNVTLDGLDVQHSTTIHSGRGVATIDAGNSVFHGPTHISTGASADLVQLNGPDLDFNGPLCVELGGGADVLQLDAAGQNGARAAFAGKVRFIGGAGNDTLKNFNGVTSNADGRFRISGFETRTLTTDTIAPTVSFIDPTNGATDVALNKKIAVTFSEPMDPLTINTANVTVDGPGQTPIAGTVAYVGTTMTFTPDAPLPANTVVGVTISTGVRDLAGNALASNFVSSFTTGAVLDTTPPTVSSTDPANGATLVALNKQISATFSESMDPLTLTTADVTVVGPGQTQVSGSVAYAGSTLTFTPSASLTPNTSFTVTIGTGAKDLAGNSLASAYSWSFSTGATPDTTAPTVSSTDPVRNETGVALNKHIAATFSESMDPTTITTANVTVVGPGQTPVSGTVSYAGSTVTFIPSADLAGNTTYTATIGTGARDLGGNALAAPYIWSFTTGATPDTTPPTVTSTNPAMGATAVPLNQQVAATFSESLDPLTITTANVTVTGPGQTPVVGTVSYAGTTVSFTPTTTLAPNTTFTATIGTGVHDLAGNALVMPYVWSFTTGATPDTTAPTVSSTDPAANASGVALNKRLSATFSEAMDPLTINTATVMVQGPGQTNIAGTVAYVGTTVTFTPTATLAANTAYTLSVSTGAEDLAGNPLAANFVSNFTTGATLDTTAPSVSSTHPGSNATGVPLNEQVAATFTETLDPQTVTNANVTVTGPGQTPVAGTVAYAGATLTFTPSTNFLPSTLYTVTLSTGVKDSADNPLASNNVFSFTTGTTLDTVPPTVTSTSPTDAQTNVVLNKTIDATFSESLDPISLTTSTFGLTGPGNVPVSGTVNYDSVNNIATFVPSTNLAPNTSYRATITGGLNGVKDSAGNPLATDQVWNFQTGTQLAQQSVNLGSATTFGVLATASISSTGATVINGDVGLNPGTSQGIPPNQVNGTIHVDDQAATSAQSDLLAGYNDAVQRATNSQTLPGDMAGLTFTPGLYTNSSSVLIQGSGLNPIVTLDAQGDPNAIFIFQMASTLTTATNAQVVLAGGAKANNVFWQVGSSATLNTGTIFKGNVLAAVTITVNSGSAIEGRLLGGSSMAGSVTVNNSTVTVPSA